MEHPIIAIAAAYAFGAICGFLAGFNYAADIALSSLKHTREVLIGIAAEFEALKELGTMNNPAYPARVIALREKLTKKYNP